MDNDKLPNDAASTDALPDKDLKDVVGGTDLRSLTLQDSLNKQTQAVNTISNIMKSISSTQETIIDNLK